jgi:hypothetical protein
MTSDQSPFGEADDLVTGDNEVVDDAHVHQAQRGLQRLSQELIRTAGFGLAAGVVVGHRQCCRVARQRTFHQFPGVHRGLGQRAAEQLLGLDQTVVRVQVQHEEDLVFQACAVQPKPVAQDLRGSHHGAFVHLLAKVAQQQLAGHAEPTGQQGLR